MAPLWIWDSSKNTWRPSRGRGSSPSTWRPGCRCPWPGWWGGPPGPPRSVADSSDLPISSIEKSQELIIISQLLKTFKGFLTLWEHNQRVYCSEWCRMWRRKCREEGGGRSKRCSRKLNCKPFLFLSVTTQPSSLSCTRPRASFPGLLPSSFTPSFFLLLSLDMDFFYAILLLALIPRNEFLITPSFFLPLSPELDFLRTFCF